MTWDLRLHRIDGQKESTLGEFIPPADGDEAPPRISWSLEEAHRPVKVQGETCIPPGLYPLRLVHDSPLALIYYERFDWFRGLPSIEDVPNFTAIRIHPGNDAVNPDDPTDTTNDDTDGCPLPGSGRQILSSGDWRVTDSGTAFKELCLTIYAAADEHGEDELRIQVEDDDIIV